MLSKCMDYPDALGIVGGVEITENAVGLRPGDRFAVRVHNTTAAPCRCSLRFGEFLKEQQWESFELAPSEERNLREIPGTETNIRFPEGSERGRHRIFARFEPLDGSEGIAAEVWLCDLTGGLELEALDARLKAGKAVAEQRIWDEYLRDCWPDELAQGIAWHALQGSSAELIAEQMGWMVNDDPEEAKRELELFRAHDAPAIQERVKLAAARVEAYLTTGPAIA